LKKGAIMAKILGGGSFGTLSGKLGSMIFAHNRAGNYIRTFVKPVDPRSISQLNSRANFGTSSNNYHSMSAAQKVAWKTFAVNQFLPESGIMGISTGQNAFTALMNVVKNSNHIGVTEFAYGVGTLAGTKYVPAFNFTPPVNMLQTNFKDSVGNIIPYNLGVADTFLSLEINDNNYTYNFNFDLIMPSLGLTPAGTLSNFEDAVGNGFGFRVFMSNSFDQPGMFVQNPKQTLLSQINGFSTITTPPTTVNLMNISQEQDVDGRQYIHLPQVGEWTQLSFYAVSNTGMMIKLGAKQVLVEAV
jgi:hypothetical protein